MISKKELGQAIKEEMREHGSRKLAKKIVSDHLKKNPNQYSKPKGYLKGSRGLLSNKPGLLGNNN